MWRGVWAGARKDLVRRLRDPLALVLWMLIPLVTGGLMTVLFGGGSTPMPRGTVYLVDEDESFLSGFVAQALGGGQLGDMLELERVELAEARERLDGGEGSALLRIPAGFGAAVLRDEATTLELRLNPSQRIVPGIVQSSLELLQDAVFYLQRAFGEEIRGIIDRVGSRDEKRLRNALSLGIGRAIQSVDEYVFPPLMVLESRKREGPKRAPFALLLVPGLIVFSLLFVAQGLSEDLWKERELQTLSRSARLPGGARVLLFGKILGYALLILPMTALLVWIAMAWHDVDASRYVPITVFGWVAGVGLLSLMLLLQTLASSQRGAAIFTSVLVFPLAMLGGSIFPLSALPDFLAWIGGWTPNGWATSEMSDMFVRGVDWGRWALGILGMLAWSLLFIALTMLRVRRSWLGGA
jgi:ABC-type Na+ efflux pump permease subunit